MSALFVPSKCEPNAATHEKDLLFKFIEMNVDIDVWTD